MWDTNLLVSNCFSVKPTSFFGIVHPFSTIWIAPLIIFYIFIHPGICYWSLLSSIVLIAYFYVKLFLLLLFLSSKLIRIALHSLVSWERINTFAVFCLTNFFMHKYKMNDTKPSFVSYTGPLHFTLNVLICLLWIFSSGLFLVYEETLDFCIFTCKQSFGVYGGDIGADRHLYKSMCRKGKVLEDKWGRNIDDMEQ